jgi:hypothetical protein
MPHSLVFKYKNGRFFSCGPGIKINGFELNGIAILWLKKGMKPINSRFVIQDNLRQKLLQRKFRSRLRKPVLSVTTAKVTSMDTIN